jgi:hypothetical protein
MFRIFLFQFLSGFLEINRRALCGYLFLSRFPAWRPSISAHRMFAYLLPGGVSRLRQIRTQTGAVLCEAIQALVAWAAVVSVLYWQQVDLLPLAQAK